MPVDADRRETHVTTYALLDCAAYENAFIELSAGYSLTRWQSLFADTPEAGLQSAAPILIDLDSAGDGMALRAWLLQLERVAPGVSWIDSEYSLPVLAGMLTNRLPCLIDGDKEVVLRFYDPRILLGLPSALDAKRKAWFFAPVLRWTAWEPRREEHYGIDAPPRPSADDMARFGVMPLSLDLQQRERLMYYDREALYDSIVTHWEDTCPEAIDEIKPAMLREIAAAAVARCSSYGIDGAADQHLFAGLMMTVSPSFDDHPAVQRYLRDASLAPSERLDAMIAGLPDPVWQQLDTHQRMDALFEHAPAA
jgi:hypothetical protein